MRLCLKGSFFQRNSILKVAVSGFGTATFLWPYLVVCPVPLTQFYVLSFHKPVKNRLLLYEARSMTLYY
ncbi:hypothetical protein AFM12_15075 [Jiulongibacter sediminis]|uniref:Uncharacterized protein n=1 Tax=Jiulongibacter sediminis TaxID=1605367 RepID=A0A0P7BRX6_9BACT|nr:hypothetical protein AFM12_15075 [Jiulongibacter sediminis]TBX22700.1 hypothetical protein TK44_15085 [Jiulongibacter sediminis]